MIYLVAADLPSEPASQRFRRPLDRPDILQIPSAHNNMAAPPARVAGFEALA